MSHRTGSKKIGKVWLVGAGPGDPELLTRKAERVLREADVVAYDELVSEAILALVPASVERIAVGRRSIAGGNGCRHHDGRIHPLVIARAKAGKLVVRLKGGDPMVFGRGGEEARELADAGIPFEIVPGISAALGAAASAHIPLTYRNVSTSLTFATAHGAEGSDSDAAHFVQGLPPNGTIVFYMGLGRLRQTTAAMVAAGWPSSTPAAVVSKATLPDEKVVVGTLASLAAEVEQAEVAAPALIVVGEVVAHVIASPSLATKQRAERIAAPMAAGGSAWV